MARPFDRKLVTEDGAEYYGWGFGAACDRAGELVFDTSMFGYQNILTTPAYAGQLVVLTYPLCGNYGVSNYDEELDIATAGALVVREYNPAPSNWTATGTLSDRMKELGVPGIEGIDTRALTRRLRDGGVLRAVLTNADTDKEEALAAIRDAKPATPADVSCASKWYYRTPSNAWQVVAVDSGITAREIRLLNRRGCNLTVLPYNATAEQVLACRPHGVYLSGGPGDPADATELIALVQALRGKLPIAANGLGCEAMGLACGARTVPLAEAHRGSNLPVRCLLDGSINTTAQHHAYTFAEDSLTNPPFAVTHQNQMDGTPEAIRSEADRMVGTLFVPTAEPSMDGEPCWLFDTFINDMKEAATHA